MKPLKVMSLTKGLGSFLLETRIDRGYAAKQVAARVGHTASFVCNVEAGRSIPSLRALEKWLDFLSVSVILLPVEADLDIWKDGI